MPTAEELNTALSHVSIRAGALALEVRGVTIEDDHVCIVVQSLVYDGHGMVRDIREQVLKAPLPLMGNLERVRAFAAGHREGLRMAFESGAADIENAMPHELVHLNVLELSTPQTPEEFTQALMSKKRLGKWIAN